MNDFPPPLPVVLLILTICDAANFGNGRNVRFCDGFRIPAIHILAWRWAGVPKASSERTRGMASARFPVYGDLW
ncbi:MAG: hypothetical protein AAAB35_05830, partial [Phyllobacterium sp.]|uniref:hypothetical protein n=1 Tax=Phyllobacterium sp. TaxID=1871046 RepID=UPI0030F288B8